MERIIKKIEEPYLKTNLPKVEPGDMVKVSTKVFEGDKSRLQVFEGVVISVRGEGLGRTIKVRKISYGIGVERTFPLHAPNVDHIDIVKKSSPRRSKLFYLRDRVGKRALKVKNSNKKIEYEELSVLPVDNGDKVDKVEEIAAVSSEVGENVTPSSEETLVDNTANVENPQVVDQGDAQEKTVEDQKNS